MNRDLRSPDRASTPDLFLFYLGGAVAGATIEVHDVQFGVGVEAADAVPSLVARWWGRPSSLHIDTYARIRWADGHDVVLTEEAASDDGPHLYFVNAGGYLPGEMLEAHAIGLFVAHDEKEAKKRALSALLRGASAKHKDNLMDVDDCLRIDEVGGLHVRLTPNADGAPLVPEYQGYWRIP